MSSALGQHRSYRDPPGFTLVEVTIILLVLTILGTILLPQLGNYNRLARFIKVHEDVGAFCAELKKMLDETMEGAFWIDPQGRTLPVGLLAGQNGGIPAGAPIDSEDWLDPVPGGPGTHTTGSMTHSTDVGTGGPTPVTFEADALENHFQMNSPGLPAYASSSQYDNPRTLPAEWWAMGWHGPYFNKIDTDPWGNRYACNVFALHSASDGSFFTSAVVCLSAGPNERIDTDINMPYKTSAVATFGGYNIGTDDIACVLSAGGPF